LLRHTAAVSGLCRIRFTSPHPSDMSERVIDAMAGSDVICPQLHLPVQAGSDRVLSSMGREYTVAGYEALVARLRARIPGIALSTDVNQRLVGSDVEVLVEGAARRGEGWMAGKSPHMKTVVFPGPATAGEL